MSRVSVDEARDLWLNASDDELIRREGRYASLWASWTAAQARAS